MNTDCVNCKHARLWTDKEQFEYIERIFNHTGRMSCRAEHYICDKIPKGKEWTENEETYTYDGYSLDGENYDEVFHCFEPQESEEIKEDTEYQRQVEQYQYDALYEPTFDLETGSM